MSVLLALLGGATAGELPATEIVLRGHTVASPDVVFIGVEDPYYKSACREAIARGFALQYAARTQGVDAVPSVTAETVQVESTGIFRPSISTKSVRSFPMDRETDVVLYLDGIPRVFPLLWTTYSMQWAAYSPGGERLGRGRFRAAGRGKDEACQRVGVRLANKVTPRVGETTLALADLDGHDAAFELAAHGDVPGFYDAMRAAEAKAPNDPDVQLNLAVAALASGDLEDAERRLRDADGAEPDALRGARDHLAALRRAERKGYRLAPTGVGAEVAVVDLGAGGDAAELRVITDPPGARVFVGADELGVTPLDIRGVKPGDAQVTLVLEHHAPVTRTVSLQAGGIEALDVPLDPDLGILRVQVEPGSTVRIDGQTLPPDAAGWVVVERPVGGLKVEVQHDQRVAWSQWVEVEANRTTEVRADQPLSAARLRISGTPHATVRIDGVEVDTDGYAIEIEPGAREVLITADRYEPQRLEIDLAPGESGSLEYELEPVRVEARVQVDAPVPVRIAIGDVTYEQAPSETTAQRVPAGEHVVTVQHPDYAPWRHTVTLDASRVVPVELQPLPGQVLVVSSPVGAEVFVGGVSKGPTPAKVELPAGEATITVRLDGYEDGVRMLEILPNQDHRVNVTLKGAE